MEDVLFMIFRVTMEELMVKANPTLYRKYISYGNMGEALLYVLIQKELYIYLNSTLLLYENWLVAWNNTDLR